MRPPCTPIAPLRACSIADPLASLSQMIVRAHLGVSEHLAYRHGEREPRLRSVPGSGARAQSARARLQPHCAFAVLCVYSSGAQAACACTLSSRMCEWSRSPGWIS
jgi:hypothetical protein